MLKPIEGYSKYLINENGEIFSTKGRKVRKIKPWYDSRHKYLIIALTSDVDNKSHRELVHRLVAKTYIPNPENYPVVNHLNYKTDDNRVENLEWCTTKHNMYHSFLKNSPVRNYIECDMFCSGIYIRRFHSITEAARYGKDVYGASYSGLIRNLKSKQI